MSTNDDAELCLISLNRAELRDAVRQVIDDDDLGQSWTEAELTDHIESVLDQYDLSGGQEIDVDQLRADLHDDLYTDLHAELQETQITPSDVEDIVYRVLDDVTDGGFGEGGYGDGGFGGDPDRLDDIEARLDALEAREPTEPDLSNYVTRGEAADLIDARLREMDLGDGGEVSEALVREVVYDILDELDITTNADALDFPARRVGPSEPSGDLHGADFWGLEFSVRRDCYIQSALIDSGEAGTFTVQLGEFDGETFNLVDETELQVNAGVQRVDLDLQVPEAGTYLLARRGTHPLRRGEWSGWDEHHVDKLRLIGGNKPDSEGGPGINTARNGFYYSWFDIEFTANESLEFDAE